MGVREKGFALGRELSAGLSSREQADSEGLLEVLESGADGRLRDMQTFGGLVQSSGGLDGQEGSNQLEVHELSIENIYRTIK